MFIFFNEIEKDFKVSNVPIFICSCSYTHDILIYTLHSFQKYFKDRPFQINVGGTTGEKNIDFPGINLLECERSCWKDETIEQLNLLREISTSKFLILYLDDFVLINDVKINDLFEAIKYAEINNIKYLRLSFFESSIFFKYLFLFKNKLFSNKKYFKIPKNHPYFSSLQVAIWNIDYLLESIEKADNIWDFETKINNTHDHYCTLATIFPYKHIVEKSAWNYYAKQICLKSIGFFDQGSRKLRKKYPNFILDYFRYLNFSIFGYSFMRFKKYFLKNK